VSKVSKQFEKIIQDVIERSVKSGLVHGYGHGYEQGKKSRQHLFGHTEQRLRAYPELRKNVEKYSKDIEDLKKETRIGASGRAKDVVYNNIRGIRLTPEEKLIVKIATIETRIKNDEAEIKEIEYALLGIDSDPWKHIIAYKYFFGEKDDAISNLMHCDERTVRRHKNRLVEKIMLRLYGAESL
jgi:hypothetical protein